MKKPTIKITDAINIAVKYACIENDDPYCVSAVYESGYFALTIYTAFQKYEFYVNSYTGELDGIISEPMLLLDEESCRCCA